MQRNPAAAATDKQVQLLLALKVDVLLTSFCSLIKVLAMTQYSITLLTIHILLFPTGYQIKLKRGVKSPSAVRLDYSYHLNCLYAAPPWIFCYSLPLDTENNPTLS